MSNNISDVQDIRGYRLSIGACVLGNFFWGFSYLLTRIAQRSAIPTVQLSSRFIVTFVLMSLMILVKPSLFRMKGKPVWALVLIGSMMPIYYYLESNGIYYTNSSFASLALALVPVLALIFAALLLKEFPTKRQIIFSFFPVVGVILITLANSAMGAIQPIGIVILACACVFSTLNRIVNRKFASDFNAFERTYACMAIGAIVFTTSTLISTGGDVAPYLDAVKDPSFVIASLTLGIVCSIGGNTLVNYSFVRLPVIKTSALGTLSTVCAMVVGIVFLHEPINALSLFGSLVTLLGIWQVTMVRPTEAPVSFGKKKAAAVEAPASSDSSAE